MTDQQLESLLSGMQHHLEKMMDEKLSAMEARYDAKLEQLDLKIEKVETTLLTEFHKWASPIDARLRTHTSTLRAIDLEMESVTERVQKLEDRTN